ncbi:ArsR/SmtB family transcription factor [Maritimibacter dapengensis]|uniref:Metalloregulator ArsR/SmtB family transcription factor n=1 Tax=Maritimibacter dapengensis TaxID=2836868 RepID=A0ABS6T1N0_9RHOB|nr:metalloregulator ArsR/SmtB family transcription factor [Maritimibacter dapengensis]MBV7378461.1 metalloregulator ArsR/SmtB family transcription factor [Maritimibacter dapengensis]
MRHEQTIESETGEADLAPHAEEISALMRVLGHEGRLMILTHLHAGTKTVAQLQDLVGAPQPVVSSHLARMRYEGLVTFERQGKHSVYRLTDSRAKRLLDHINVFFCNGLRDHL